MPLSLEWPPGATAPPASPPAATVYIVNYIIVISTIMQVIFVHSLEVEVEEDLLGSLSLRSTSRRE